MSLYINTNSGALAVQKNLAGASSKLLHSVSSMSSGQRINSAADDSAGLAISEGLRAQASGSKVASSNAAQGVAMLQTADGAMQSISDTLTRMRELAVQSASDGLTDKERAHAQTEFALLQAEIDRVSKVTEYNGQKLLDGTAGNGAGLLTFQVGTRNTADDQITITMSAVDTSTLGVDASAVDSLANAQTAIDDIDAAFDLLNPQRSTVGATINQFGRSITNLETSSQNLNIADANVRDVDVASEAANFSKAQVLQQASVAMLAQANAAPQLALRLLQ